MRARHEKLDPPSTRAGMVPRGRDLPHRRALVKIAVLVVLANQILTTAFAFLAHRNYPDVAFGLTTLFSVALCSILIVWIRTEAKYAWEDAVESGVVSPVAIARGSAVVIRPECPRRWLVVLHVEWKGGFAATE
ncbi:hypothetical protein [Paraburkholderia sp. BR10923]|uniref:Uncharacterized protein n=1 Tax=Paraburkholderia youngii TaxID=2782701 RepID=A0A7Y6K1H3_9BURK|nr:hypothetical protein [Paraburkholderia youngii]